MTLVILAAGLGSRFGGMKQVAPFGPTGEFIIDYLCYDAIKTGYDKIVFVIKRENLDLFRESVGSRVEPHVRVEYAFQDMDDLPSGYKVPEGRVKPWGTAHALLAARHCVESDFATANADDYVGPEVYKAVFDYMSSRNTSEIAPIHCCIAGISLRNTLSKNGPVSRGICCVDDNGMLIDITERTKIVSDGEDALFEENCSMYPLSGDAVASMNCFGLTPEIFAFAENEFISFLDKMQNPLKDEFYLPTLVSSAKNCGFADVKVCNTEAKWYGVTYADDTPYVKKSIQKLIEDGSYPSNLWGIKDGTV